jgi:hypothetical protein
MGNVNYRQITAQGSLDPRPYLQVTSDQNDLSLISPERSPKIYLPREDW